MSSTRTRTTAETPIPTPTARETATPELDVRDPHATRQFGESFDDDGLVVTVESLDVSSTFHVLDDTRNASTPTPDETGTRTDREGQTGTATATDRETVTPTRTGSSPREYEMPAGEALAFAEVTVGNSLDEAELRVAGPLFVLVGDDREYVERRTVSHQAFENPIRAQDLSRVDREIVRWDANRFGTAVEPGEEVSLTAVFHVTETPERDQAPVVYHPAVENSVPQSRTVVSWTETG